MGGVICHIIATGVVLGGEIEGTKQREQNDAAEVDAKLLAAEDRQMLACSQADVLGELDVELEQSYMPSVAYKYILFIVLVERYQDTGTGTWHPRP